MKTTSPFLPGATCLAAALVATALPASAVDSAKVSEVVQDVSISGQPASVGETLAGSAALKTGSRSRAELTFEDTTLLRVGSNTVFSFLGNKGTAKEFSLTQGTAFVASPTTHGGVNVRCGGVTAAIEGCLVTFGFTSQGLFVGVAQETGDDGGGGVTIGGHKFKSNEAAFIPFGPDGELDMSKATFFKYDGSAQLLSGDLYTGIDPKILMLADEAKKVTFSTNEANSSPGVQKDPTFQLIRNIEALAARNPPPPNDCNRCKQR